MRIRCFRLLTFCLPALTFSGFSQTWKIDSLQSKVRFTIRNFGIDVEGELSGLTGSIQFDVNNPEGSKLAATLPAASVQTGIKLRDQHLKESTYFDSKSFPFIQFESTQVQRTPQREAWQVYGKLNVKRTTQNIVIVFIYKINDDRILFNGHFKLNRLDFDVGKSSISLSDEVSVEVEAVAIRSTHPN